MNYFDKNHIEKLWILNSSYVKDGKLERLKYIYDFSENKFLENLERIRKTKVKYLLFGEAPPWTEKGEPRYFYSNIDSKLHKSFWKAFFSVSIPPNITEAYQKLAEKQFLLLDSLPFALKYNSRMRSKVIYKEIILEYLTFQLSRINEKIEFDENLKIAFAFRMNGYAIIDSLKGIAKIGDKLIELKEGNIAADGSGFPKPIGLKRVFDLD
jgi:hypothetical protein